MTFPQKTLILIVLLIFGIVTLVAITPYEEPQDPYCEMVGIWIDSGGEYGWPDYRGNGECENRV